MKVSHPLSHYALIFVLITLAAASQTLSLKANIGVCACWDALSLNIYEITGLKVGTFSILANLCVVAIQFAILGRDFHPVRLLQIPVAMLYGTVMNLIYYHVLTFELTSYGMRLLFCVLSYVGLGIFLGGVTLLDLIPMPTEGTCYAIHRKFRISFSKVRISLDAALIVSSIALSLLFGLSFKIREGTLIGMLLLGPLEQFFMRLEGSLFPSLRRQNLTQKENGYGT